MTGPDATAHGAGSEVGPPFRSLRLDPEEPTAPYEQIRAALAALITSGELAAGDRLPTVRALAGHLGVAVNTVAKAYRELTVEGLAEGHSRAGTVVAATDHAAQAALERAAAAYAALAAASGLSEAEALVRVRDALLREGL